MSGDLTNRPRILTLVAGLLCLAFCWSGQDAAQDAAHDERVKEVLRHLPPIAASDPDIETVTLRGWHATGLGCTVLFNVAYGGQGHFVVVVRDAVDEVPLWIATSETSLAYDARRGELVQVHAARPNLFFGEIGGGFRSRVEFAAGVTRDAGKSGMNFSVDARSLLHSMVFRTWRRGEGSFFAGVTLTQTEKGPATLELDVRGMRIAAVVDPASRFGLLSAGVSLNSEQARSVGIERAAVAVGKPGDWEAWDAVVTDVVVNQPLPPKALVTPTPEDIKGLVIREATEADVQALEYQWAVRAAIRRSELREAVERQVGPVDWQEAERLDKIASKPWKAYVDSLYRPGGEQGASASPGR